jgi:amino acid transporter
LGYLAVNNAAGQVFNWFVSLTNTAGYTSWIVCSVTFLRFRKGYLLREVTVPYHSFIQPYATWICLVKFTILLLCNGFTVFYPGQFTASGFLTAYVGIPIFLVLWIGHKLTIGLKDPWMRKIEDLDLTTGVAETEADAEMWTRLEKEQGEDTRWSKIRALWS